MKVVIGQTMHLTMFPRNLPQVLRRVFNQKVVLEMQEIIGKLFILEQIPNFLILIVI
ncbi:hypothetical protein HMPREF0204_15256 [Chryseobacterium gleum ATCC 35910]|uniref:Uncharacterized protein n=1 Tax=Chryseobacterium gleum ATCC 35910 TaxID=525257 RepID=A0ABP2ISJ6_CHRGE|nr:hypothetical protein HMPREF0204_15256 [Chryseobacterium gleum ATCC 35910]